MREDGAPERRRPDARPADPAGRHGGHRALPGRGRRRGPPRQGATTRPSSPRSAACRHRGPRRWSSASWPGRPPPRFEACADLLARAAGGLGAGSHGRAGGRRDPAGRGAAGRPPRARAARDPWQERARGGGGLRRRSPDRPRRDRRGAGRTRGGPYPRLARRPTAWTPSSCRRPAALVGAGSDAGLGGGRAAACGLRRASARQGRRTPGAAGRLAPGERAPLPLPALRRAGPLPRRSRARDLGLQGRGSRPQPCRGQHPARPDATSTRPPTAAAGPTAWSAPRTRPATRRRARQRAQDLKDLARLGGR